MDLVDHDVADACQVERRSSRGGTFFLSSCLSPYPSPSISSQLPQQDPGRAKEQPGLLAAGRVEPDVVTNPGPLCSRTAALAALLRHALGDGHGREPPRLRADDRRPSPAELPGRDLEQVLRDLRRLSAARVPSDDDDVASGECFEQRAPDLADGQKGALAGPVLALCGRIEGLEVAEHALALELRGGGGGGEGGGMLTRLSPLFLMLSLLLLHSGGFVLVFVVVTGSVPLRLLLGSGNRCSARGHDGADKGGSVGFGRRGGRSRRRSADVVVVGSSSALFRRALRRRQQPRVPRHPRQEQRREGRLRVEGGQRGGALGGHHLAARRGDDRRRSLLPLSAAAAAAAPSQPIERQRRRGVLRLLDRAPAVVALFQREDDVRRRTALRPATASGGSSRRR